MGDVKKVKREHLQHLDEELFLIKLQSPERLQDRIQKLIEYVHENIMENTKEMINELKVMAFKKMKSAQTPEENAYWFKYYKSLDDELK